MSAPQCALVIVSATKAGIITFERPAKDGLKPALFPLCETTAQLFANSTCKKSCPSRTNYREGRA